MLCRTQAQRLCRLKVSKIDRQRIMLRIELRKNGERRQSRCSLESKVDCDVREYWR